MRRTIVLMLLAMLLACTGALRADEQAGQEHNAQREAALKMKKGQELIDAAGKIVGETGSNEVKALLKAAQASYREASMRYDAGELEEAARGFSDSIKTAISAVLLSSGPHEEGARDTAIRKAADESALRGDEKKKALLVKATEEVDAFVRAAEKMAASGGGAPSERLQEARELYASSKMKSVGGDYDGALEDMTEAYELATAAIRELKRARGEALTFRKSGLTDSRELFAFEINKNNTYAFFASRTVSGGEKETVSLLRAAKKARDQAQRSMDKGDGAKAIERLRLSTELYIQAIRESGE